MSAVLRLAARSSRGLSAARLLSTVPAMRRSALGASPRVQTALANSSLIFAAPNTMIESSSRRFYSDLPAHTLLTMPSLSPTMTRGKVISWIVKEGDKFTAGKSLAEIETDKAILTFDATDDGVLAKILVQAGDNADVNQAIAVAVEDSADVAKFASFTAQAEAKPAAAVPPPAAAPTPVAVPPVIAATPATPAPVASQNGDRIFASPLAKKLAQAAGIALRNVTGTGPNNRVTKADIEAYQSANIALNVKQQQQQQQQQQQSSIISSNDFIDFPLSNVRSIIAARLTESKQKIPHYYLSIDVNIDNLLNLRKKFNDENKGEFKLSVNDFIIKASALSLLKVPEVNSSWQDTFIRQYNNADISIAVSTDNGLITPIVFNANNLGLVGIAKATKELAEKARASKLKPQEFQGGTFTISNLGMFGIKSFTAIINPPQSCILAVGAGEERIVPDASSATGFRKANILNVTMSCDHRVVDGAVGAKWLSVFKKYVESPESMLL